MRGSFSAVVVVMVEVMMVVMAEGLWLWRYCEGGGIVRGAVMATLVGVVVGVRKVIIVVKKRRCHLLLILYVLQ